MIFTDFAGADGFLSSIIDDNRFLKLWRRSYHFYLNTETPRCITDYWGSFIEVT